MPLEHINITVPDAKAFATRLQNYFDWKIRWEGEAKAGGYSYHVGDNESYIAVYRPKGETYTPNYDAINHIAVTVDDLDKCEAQIKALGLATHSHGDYEPGRRFYFDDPIGIEIEVVSYN